MSRTFRWLCCLAIAFGLLAVAPVQSLQAQSPPCTGSGCNAQSPDQLFSGAYTCASPPSGYSVQTQATATAPVDRDNNGVFDSVITIELRYSNWCNAYWGRGAFQAATGQTTWSYHVQVTSTNAAKTVNYESLYTQNQIGIPQTSAMYGPSADACLKYYITGTVIERVCTHQIRLRFAGAASFGQVGTNCNAPTSSPVSNNWRFLVTGLAPPAGNNAPRQIYDGAGGIWVNYSMPAAVDPGNTLHNLCISPGRWPMVSQNIVISNGSSSAFAGHFLYIAAWPGTNTPGQGLVSGRTYTLDIYTYNTVTNQWGPNLVPRS